KTDRPAGSGGSVDPRAPENPVRIRRTAHPALPPPAKKRCAGAARRRCSNDRRRERSRRRTQGGRTVGTDAPQDTERLLCLVTGASGYIGGRLVPELLAAGHRVRCLARSPDKLRDHPWAADAETV